LAGRGALELQARGHEVVAFDVSPGAVEVCRRRGVKDARVLGIDDVGPHLGTFDTVLLLGVNFGLLAGWLEDDHSAGRRPPALRRRAGESL
jgi:hypothetical protein